MPKFELPYTALSLKKSRMYFLCVCWQALKSEKLFFFLSFMATLIDLHAVGKHHVNKNRSREWWKFLKRQVWVICILSRYKYLRFYIKMKPPINIIEQLGFLKICIFSIGQFKKVTSVYKTIVNAIWHMIWPKFKCYFFFWTLEQFLY